MCWQGSFQSGQQRWCWKYISLKINVTIEHHIQFMTWEYMILVKAELLRETAVKVDTGLISALACSKQARKSSEEELVPSTSWFALQSSSHCHAWCSRFNNSCIARPNPGDKDIPPLLPLSWPWWFGIFQRQIVWIIHIGQPAKKIYSVRGEKKEKAF